MTTSSISYVAGIGGEATVGLVPSQLLNVVLFDHLEAAVRAVCLLAGGLALAASRLHVGPTSRILLVGIAPPLVKGGSTVFWGVSSFRGRPPLVDGRVDVAACLHAHGLAFVEGHCREEVRVPRELAHLSDLVAEKVPELPHGFRRYFLELVLDSMSSVGDSAVGSAADLEVHWLMMTRYVSLLPSVAHPEFEDALYELARLISRQQ